MSCVQRCAGVATLLRYNMLQHAHLAKAAAKVVQHESALVATEAALERGVVHNMERIAYNGMRKTNAYATGRDSVHEARGRAGSAS